MPLTLDLRELHAVTAQAVKQLRAVPREMLRVGQYWAAYERATHPYTNRTYRLQRSTDATMSSMGDGATLCLRMEMFYASYVDNLGYSNIRQAAAGCKVMLADVMERTGQGLR